MMTATYHPLTNTIEVVDIDYDWFGRMWAVAREFRLLAAAGFIPNPADQHDDARARRVLRRWAWKHWRAT